MRTLAKTPRFGNRYLRVLFVQAAWVVLIKSNSGPEWMRREPRRFAFADQNLRAHGCIPLDQAPE